MNASIGVLLALVSGLFAVACGVFVAGTLEPLLGLIVVFFIAGEVRDNKDNPVAHGIVCAIASVFLGAIIIGVGKPEALWALLLVWWFADDLV